MKVFFETTIEDVGWLRDNFKIPAEHSKVLQDCKLQDVPDNMKQSALILMTRNHFGLWNDKSSVFQNQQEFNQLFT